MHEFGTYVICEKSVKIKTIDCYRVPTEFDRKDAALAAVRGVLANHNRWECLERLKAKIQ